MNTATVRKNNTIFPYMSASFPQIGNETAEVIM
jgi:hypothetical protein